MSEDRSFRIRIASKHQDDAAMALPIEDELFQIARRAAGPVTAGMTVKAQRVRAWENLGRPPMWRLLSAWYRDGSSSWSAQAVRDFQQRFLSWQEREASRSASSAATERARQRRLDRDMLERSREQIQAQLARVERQLAGLKNGGDPA